MKIRGFTLLELLIVLVIIGLITVIALPNFTKINERARQREAKVNLKLIAAAQRTYKMEMGYYYPSSGNQTDIGYINNNLQLSLNENDWDYIVYSNDTAEAIRTELTGCKYSIVYEQAAPVGSGCY